MPCTFGDVGRKASAAFAALFLSIIPGQALEHTAEWPMAGINMAGGEFGPGQPRLDIDYRYPRPAELDYYYNKGFRLFRVPFKAERLLTGHGIHTRISERDFAFLDALIDYTAAKGAKIVLDMHDYGWNRYGQAIGNSEEATNVFIRDWEVLAQRLSNRNNVIIGLMNEPKEQAPARWVAAANKAIAAIRQAESYNLILVPGAAWSTAAKWQSSGNAEAMKSIRDPLNNYMIEVHQYLDPDHSGTTGAIEPGGGARRLVEFTRWARENRVRAFLGEFGWTDNQPSHVEGHALLTYVTRNKDVWAGWAAWSGGAWWGDYAFSLEPNNGKDSAVLDTIRKFMPQSELERRELLFYAH